MRRSIKYLLLFMIALTVAFGWNATSVYATEAGNGITTGENVLTGKTGTNGGFTWTYDQNTKTLTVTGKDSGLGSSDKETGYNPFLVIAQEAERIILQNCKISGGMNGAFSNCVRLKSVEFLNTDTSKVTGMRHMFYNCMALTNLYMNGLDTSNVTDMSGMFYGSGLTLLDLSDINTSNVTDMSYMFYGCSNLTNLKMNGLDTSKVTDMTYMFGGCKNLTKLNIKGLDTPNVKAMGHMFYNCNSLSSLNVSSFDTSKVTGMGSMFSGCSSLTTLDVSNFNTAKVKGMGSMFKGCKSLTSLDVSNFNTASATGMKSMFENCTNLQSLNLQGLQNTNVTSMKSMFSGCSSLTSLNLSGFKTPSVTNMSGMFSSCSSLKSLKVSSFNTSNITDMYYMFGGCSSLTSLNLSNFDTSNVTNMRYMFKDCSSLKSLDVSSFNTSNVTYIHSMFSGCSSLASLDVSGFDTSNVTEMSYMFYGCSNLTSLDLSNFDTSKVTDMDYMFGECSSLASLDVSAFDTSSVTDMAHMFTECSSLTSLDVSNFDTSNVISMFSMFMNCASLSSLDVSGFDTSNVTEMTQMFAYCTNLRSLDVSKFNTSKVTGMHAMFRECFNLQKVDVSDFGTPKVTTMAYMFSGCSSLTSLDVSSFDTSNVTDMRDMFDSCSSLTSLDVSSFDVSTVTSLDEIFEDCDKLNSIHTPKRMAAGQKIELPHAFMDMNGEEVSYITSALCKTVLYKEILRIVADTTELTVGETLQLALKLYGVKQNVSENDNYKWSVASEKVATVSDTGMVTAVGPGTTTITVTGKVGNGDSVVSRDVDITVTPKLAITSQPTSQTVEAGESATFVVEAQGTDLNYQWQYKSVDATEWAKSSMTGAKTNSITVKGTEGRNGHKYRCVITDRNGNKVISKAVTLTVIPKLAITSQPANQSVEEGTNAVFKVEATGSKLSYQWQFKKAGENEWKDSGMTGAKTASLTVQGTATRNGYQYRCIITDGKGNKVTSDGAILTVTEVALTITDHPTNQSVEEGANAVFKVEATGSNLKYQWQFKTAGASTWTNSGMTGYNTAGITVQATAARNGYQYRCVITDGSGNKVISNEASLTVTEAVLTITGQPTSQSVNNGANAVFKVTATGSNLKYQWQFKTAGASTWKNSGMTGYNTAGITVQGTSARNGYQYRCIITDGSGNKVTSNAATLTVN